MQESIGVRTPRDRAWRMRAPFRRWWSRIAKAFSAERPVNGLRAAPYQLFVRLGKWPAAYEPAAVRLAETRRRMRRRENDVPRCVQVELLALAFGRLSPKHEDDRPRLGRERLQGARLPSNSEQAMS